MKHRGADAPATRRDERHLDTALNRSVAHAIHDALGADIITRLYADDYRLRGKDSRREAEYILRS